MLYKVLLTPYLTKMLKYQENTVFGFISLNTGVVFCSDCGS